MVNRYSEFVEERIIESLILESKFEFSDKFKKILSLMPKDNEIKNYLLGMKGADLSITQNYIDISDNKDEVTFIQDRRAQQVLKDNPVFWVTNNSLPNSKFLTFNKDENGEYKNKNLFEALGFEPNEPHRDYHPVPNSGVVGEILAETVSEKSGRTYVLFKWKDEFGNEKLICLNKDALEQKSDAEQRLYSSSRNPIRIGRLINSLMTSVGKKVTPTEVEAFSNSYKAAWEMANDAFLKFDIVSGYDIAKWYHEDNYESDESTLGGSCMRYDYCSEFFGIYTENSDVVKLVILYSDTNGSIKDGKYTSPRIKGRALLWKTNQGDMFMDRIYTNNDSDVELFKQFAEKNGWWCKKAQNSSNRFTAQKGTAFKDPTYTVDLNWADHEYYPYVDTLSYMKLNQLNSRDASGSLSNDSDVINAQYDLRDTEGDKDPLY
jgi:hypothetical protein